MSLSSKVFRTANAPTGAPDEIETSVAQALLDLENNVPELKTDLRPLQISAAREVDVKGGKKAIVIFVPVPQQKAFRKIQPRYRHIMILFDFASNIDNLSKIDSRAREEVLGQTCSFHCSTSNASQAQAELSCEAKKTPQPYINQCP